MAPAPTKPESPPLRACGSPIAMPGIATLERAVQLTLLHLPSVERPFDAVVAAGSAAARSFLQLRWLAGDHALAAVAQITHVDRPVSGRSRITLTLVAAPKPAPTRRTRREQLDEEVIVSIKHGRRARAGAMLAARVINAAPGGLGLLIGAPLDEDDELHIVLDAADGATACAGSVRHTFGASDAATGAGIEFADADAGLLLYTALIERARSRHAESRRERDSEREIERDAMRSAQEAAIAAFINQSLPVGEVMERERQAAEGAAAKARPGQKSSRTGMETRKRS